MEVDVAKYDLDYLRSQDIDPYIWDIFDVDTNVIFNVALLLNV